MIEDLRQTRLAVISSHPIQYYAPLFRALAQQLDLTVFFAHKATPEDQARAGFGTPFDWDINLTSGYRHYFLDNVAVSPGVHHFNGCDTPKLGKHLRFGRFDALLVTGWHLKVYIQGLIEAKRLGLPILVRGDSHLGTPRSSIKRGAKALVYPPFLKMFDSALYVGERSRAYYRHYGYPDDRLFFSPHSVDTKWFAALATYAARVEMRARLGIGQRTHVALFAGKLLPFKRPLDLIDAAALMRERGIELEVLVAGDGELRSEMAKRAEDAGVTMHLLGFCNQSEMPAVYAAADCLVLPSDGRETWGMVVNEALACGRPVIVSDACGCAPDLALDGTAGRQFPMADIEALSRSLVAILRAPPAQCSITAISDRYSLTGASQGVIAALASISERCSAI